MRHDRFAPFDDDQDDCGVDFDGIGLTSDDLNLSLGGDPHPFAALPSPRHRWKEQEWWETSEQEDVVGYPPFSCADDRARHLIERCARPVLAGLGATDDDAVLIDRDGEMVSLNDMLARIDYQQAAISKALEGISRL